MVGVVLAVLGYSLAAGLFAGGGHNLRTLLLVVLPAGILICLIAIRYFTLLVLVLPLTALAVPIDFSTGTESKVPISMLLALLLTTIWALSLLVRGWRLTPSPLNRPLLAFGAICIGSLIWGRLWRDPVLLDWSGRFIFVQIGALMAILLSISAGLLIGNFVTRPGQLKYLMGLFLALGSLISIGKFFQLPISFLNGNGLWALWLIAPAYGLLIAQPRLRWRWRLPLLVVLGLTLYLTIVLDSFWLSGWVPGIVAIYAITFLRSRKVFCALLIVGALVGYAERDFFQQVAQDNIDDGSLERLSLWEQNWRVVSAHWLFGTGPAGYAIYYMTYYREDARSTHNNYLDILAQFGFSGMLAWAWLAFASVWEGWKLVQRAPPGFLRTLAIIATGGWIGAMASMFFGDWVLPFAYNQTITGYKYTVYSWFFLGTLISLRHVLPTWVSPYPRAPFQQ
jgi:hypothetical protein